MAVPALSCWGCRERSRQDPSTARAPRLVHWRGRPAAALGADGRAELARAVAWLALGSAALAVGERWLRGPPEQARLGDLPVDWRLAGAASRLAGPHFAELANRCRDSLDLTVCLVPALPGAEPGALRARGPMSCRDPWAPHCPCLHRHHWSSPETGTL